MTQSLVQGIIDALSGSVGKEGNCIYYFHDSDFGTSWSTSCGRSRFLECRSQKAIPLCILGNIIPVPFILLLITPIFNWMKGTKHLKPLVDKLEAKSNEEKKTRLKNLNSGDLYYLLVFRFREPAPGQVHSLPHFSV